MSNIESRLVLREFARELHLANQACCAAYQATWVPGALFADRGARSRIQPSLQAYRRLERALVGYLQQSAPKSQLSWANHLGSQMKRVIGLCREGAVHEAYLKLALPLYLTPFCDGVTVSPHEAQEALQRGWTNRALQPDELRRLREAGRQAEKRETQALFSRAAQGMARELSPETLDELRLLCIKDTKLFAMKHLLGEVQRVQEAANRG